MTNRDFCTERRSGERTEGEANIEVMLARHDERLKGIEEDFADFEKEFAEMKGIMRQIYFALVGIAGGVIVSLTLLIINMSAGR